MDFLAQVLVWLNVVSNFLGKWLLAPIGGLPGWLSATLVSVATGVSLLIAFKYTSNQRAIQKVRDDIKANLLALKLFNDSALVILRAQASIVTGAVRLMGTSLVPMLVLAVPVLLFLEQLALWYQFRPLQVGEEAVVTLKLNDVPDRSWPNVRLEPSDAVETIIGPVRITSLREICWKIQARANGNQHLIFKVAEQVEEKELAIGEGFMRVSTLKPGWSWSDILTHPSERPFASYSPVHSIGIQYPTRASWTSGTDTWVIYWFAVSMAASLCFRRLVNVKI
jgi:hypothetical protein